MKEQVLSISQMQELIELGIDISKASMCWMTYPSLFNKNERAKELVINSNINKRYFYVVSAAIDCATVLEIPTFTLQDILEILSKPCYLNCIDNDFYQCEITTKNGSATTNGTSPLKAAFNMLKWCKQNNYI